MAKFQMEQAERVVTLQSWQRIVPILLSSLAAGAVLWLVTFILSQYIIGPMACRVGSSLISCNDSSVLSSNVALIISGVVALILFVRNRLLRPLLAVMGAIIALWGLGVFLSDDAWYISLPLTVLIATLVYAAFAWFSELRQFWVSLVITIILVIVFRLLSS